MMDLQGCLGRLICVSSNPHEWRGSSVFDWAPSFISYPCNSSADYCFLNKSKRPGNRISNKTALTTDGDVHVAEVTELPSSLQVWDADADFDQMPDGRERH